jgi:hypothetical protein
MLFPLLPPLAIIVVIIVHLMIIASPALPFLRQIESCHPLPPITMADFVFLGGVGRGTKLRPPR